MNEGNNSKEPAIPAPEPDIALPPTMAEDAEDTGPLSPEELAESLDDDEPEELEEAPRSCGDCYYYGRLFQNEEKGLCLRKSQKSGKIEKTVWVKAETTADECKFWESEYDRYWDEFWEVIDNIMTLDNLREFIENLNNKLIDRQVGQQPDETVENIEDLDLGDAEKML